MFYYSILALVKMARCLGHRFFRWEVVMQGQIVPGTGGWEADGSKALGDWCQMEEGEEPSLLLGSTMRVAEMEAELKSEEGRRGV